MRRVFLALLLLAACSKTPPEKQYQLHGQILDIKPETGEVLVRHGDIPGFMPAMTMPYKVGDPKLLKDKQPGDLIDATLVVGDTEAHLSTLDKTGHAPLVDVKVPDLTASDILQPGAAVPATNLIDENNASRPLTSYKGHRVALTFIYTRCPQPEFCPLMDRNFAAIQNEVEKTPALGDVRLVSVSFDPANDTPDVLKIHARMLEADPKIWHFETTSVADIKGFAAKFGVTAVPSDESPVILVHNLTTAVIGADGTLVTLVTGNMWTPAELIADLKAAPAPAH